MKEEENGMNPLHWRPLYIGYCYHNLQEIPPKEAFFPGG